MKSLRARALTGSILWAVAIILVGVFGLSSLVDRQTQLRFDELLENRHTQAIIAVRYHNSNPVSFDSTMGDPAYLHPFSGEYWQIESETGIVHVSPSLVDKLLPRPSTLEGAELIYNFSSQAGEQLRGMGQWIVMEDGSRWHVQVASSLQSLIDDRNYLRRNLVLIFGIIALVGIVGAFLNATMTLQPLNVLRREVATRWDAEHELDVASYPIEVAPLVSDINTLLDRNREIIKGSRRRAADLAHAIKTPSAIVRNELESLRKSGLPVSNSLDALDRLDAQLQRSLARMRSNDGSAAVQSYTDIDASLGRMTRAFIALAQNSGKTMLSDISPGLKARIDQSDFEEIMGNLLDNALKWSHSQLRISARPDGGYIDIRVEDDGEGIAAHDYGTATLSGERLDTSKPGTGLGLGIAADLAHAYGGKVKLDRSADLGGLMARVRLNASRV